MFNADEDRQGQHLTMGLRISETLAQSIRHGARGRRVSLSAEARRLLELGIAVDQALGWLPAAARPDFLNRIRLKSSHSGVLADQAPE